MTTIYVASYVNEYDYDVFTTSSELHEYSMFDFAYGFSCAAGVDREKVLAKAKVAFIREYAEYAAENDDEESILAHVAMIEGDIEYFQNEKNPKDYRVEVLGDVVGAICIREFEDD